jgi:hypothetical protein
LKNWDFIYLEDVESPAELPPVMSALKTQQYRWTKGGAETAKKHLPNVIKSDKKLGNKWHGIMHLLNSSVFISIVVCAILSIPLQNIKTALPEFGSLFAIASVFLISFVVLAAYYITAIMKVRGYKIKTILEFMFLFPLFLAVSMGLSLHNSIAVIEGYMGRKSSFVRTPKFNINEKKDTWSKNLYIPKTVSWLTAFEGLLALYFAYGIVRAFQIEDYGLLPFHAMMFVGYTMVFVYSTFQYSKGN